MIPTENYSSFKDYYIEKGANYHVKRQRLGYRSSVDGIELSLPAMLQNMKQKILEGKLKEYDNNNLPFAVIRSLIKEKGLDEKTVLLQIVKNPANFSDDYLKSTINYVLDDYNSYHGTTFNGDSNFLCFVCRLILQGKHEDVKALARLNASLWNRPGGEKTLKLLTECLESNDFHLPDHEKTILENFDNNAGLFADTKFKTKEMIEWLRFVKEHPLAAEFCQSTIPPSLKLRFLLSALSNKKNYTDLQKGVLTKLLNNPAHLETALNFTDTNPAYIDKFFDYYHVNPNDTIKISAKIRNKQQISLFINSRLKDSREICALALFYEQYGNDDRALEKMEKLLDLYPLHIIAICKLFYFQKEEDYYAQEYDDININFSNWIDLLLEKDFSSIKFLDLIQRVAENCPHSENPAIELSYFFGEKPEICKDIINFLSEFQDDQIPNVICNLFDLFHNEKVLFNKTVRHLNKFPDSSLALNSLGGLSSAGDKFNSVKYKLLINFLDRKDPRDLNRFIKYFKSNDLEDDDHVGTLIMAAIELEPSKFAALLRNCPFPPLATLKQLISIIKPYQNCQKARINTVEKWGKSRHCSIVLKDHLLSIQFDKKKVPIDLRNNLNYLISINEDEIAIKLFNLWKVAGKDRNTIECMANCAVGRGNINDLKGVLEEYEKEGLNHFIKLYLFCAENLPSEVMEGLTILKLMSERDSEAKKLLNTLLDFYNDTDMFPNAYQHVLLLYIGGNHADAKKLLEVLTKEEPDNNAERYAFSLLENGLVSSALLMLKDYPLIEKEISRRGNLTLWECLTLLHTKKYKAIDHQRTIDSIANRLEAIHTEIRKLKLDLKRFHIYLAHQFLQILVKDCICPENAINHDLLGDIVRSAKINSLIPKQIIKDVESQLDILINNSFIRKDIENLKFNGNQNGKFAFLIRLTLGLKKNESITDAHLIQFVLYHYLTGPRQFDKSNCGGVSALNSFVKSYPKDFLSIIKHLVANDSVNISHSKTPIHADLYIQADASVFKKSINLKIHHPSCLNSLKNVLGIKEIAAYFSMNEDLFNRWVDNAFQTIASEHKEELISLTHGDLLTKLKNSLIALRVVNSLSPRESQEIDTIFAGCHFDLPHETLEGLLMNFDTKQLKYSRKAIYSYFRELASVHLKDKMILDKLCTKFNNVVDKRINISLSYEVGPLESTTKLFLVDSQNRTLLTPSVINNSLDFKNLIISCMQECFQNLEAINVNHEMQSDIISDITKSDLKTFDSVFQKHYEAIIGTKTQYSVWNFELGTSKNLMQKIHKIDPHSKARCEKYRIQSPNDLLNLLVEQLSVRKGDYVNNIYNWGLFPGHGVNYDFNHPSLIPLIDNNIHKYLNEEVFKKAKEIYDKQQISPKDLVNWSNKIKSQLPEEFKRRWESEIESFLKESPVYLSQAAEHFFNTLASVHGSEQRAKYLEPLITQFSFEYIDPAVKNNFVFQFMDFNWIDLKKGEQLNLALYYNPLWLRWESWLITDDQSTLSRIPKTANFGVFKFYTKN